MIRINDRWFRVTIIACLFALAALFNEWVRQPLSLLLVQKIILSFYMIILICEGSRFIIFYSRHRFGRSISTMGRLLTIIPAGVLYVSFLLVLTAIVRFYLVHGEWRITADNDAHVYVNGTQVTIGLYGSSVFKGALIFLSLLTVYEIFYYFAKLKQTERENEKLEKEKLQAKLDSLKQKVNPHFLFNSLNSLSSLISEDPAQAEIFLDEMTKVYRYLLRNNEVELASLDTELKFIKSYSHLLKTRYGDSIDFEIDVEEEYLSYLVPPLTLQLLVENAVKHNKLLKQQPLIIQLRTNGSNEFVVKNNIQRKEIAVDSTRIGLKNISTKYRLMNQPDIVIESNDDFFSVTIPLIKNYKLENA